METAYPRVWNDAVERVEHGEHIAVVAHGEHVADVVPSGELDRLRETIDVLSDSDLVRDLAEGLEDARAGRVFTAEDVAADLEARRASGSRPGNARTHGHVAVSGDSSCGVLGLTTRSPTVRDRAAHRASSTP